MGWGASNPEPSPGHDDFVALDRRVALMLRTGATPVLTLCCAPDWMKGGRPGDTECPQQALETAPTPRCAGASAETGAAVVTEHFPGHSPQGHAARPC